MATIEKIASVAGPEREINRLDRDYRVLRLEHIAERYYEKLVNFFRKRTESQDDAADLAQDVFMKLSAADLDRVRAPGPFLFATARNLLRDRARSRSTRDMAATISADLDVLACPRPHPERALTGKEQLAVLEGALRELHPKCRAVLVLYRFDELSHRAIADRLGISVSMVEKYLKRAQDHCRRRLEEANGEEQPARKPAT